MTVSDFEQFFFLRHEKFCIFVHSLFISIQIVLKDKDKVDAKSIMEVLMLAASKNTIIYVEADGIDEKEAISSIEKLFLNYFGEGE